MTCENCGKKHDGAYGSGRFCSAKCARGFSTKKKRKEINEKVSKKLTGKANPRWRGKSNPNYNRDSLQTKAKNDLQTKLTKSCLHCHADFEVSWKRRKQKTCNRLCANRWMYNPENPDYDKNIAAQRERAKKSAASQAARRRSKNEILFAEHCKAHFGEVLTNEPMFNGWDADVIIPEIKTAVLWNGKWHYEEIMPGTSLKQIQNRDAIKLKEIARAGYEAYVIKDMGGKDEAFAKREFDKFVMCKMNQDVVE